MSQIIQAVIGVGFNENEIYSTKEKPDSTEKLVQKLRRYEKTTSDNLITFNTYIDHSLWLNQQKEKPGIVGVFGSTVIVCVTGSIANSLRYGAEVFVNPRLCITWNSQVDQMNLEDRAKEEITGRIKKSLSKHQNLHYRLIPDSKTLIYTTRPKLFF